MERGVSLKKILAVLLLVFTLGLTGCVQMVEITDEESETIARTASWLLFKYDNYYKENLVTPTPTVTPTPVPSATPTPLPDGEDAAVVTPDNGAQTEAEQAPIVLPEFNASADETLGIRDIHLEYDGYELYNSYTFDALSIEPQKPENVLLLVFLKLQNTGEEKAAVNVLETQPKCRLYVDITKQLTPKRTVLLNDFQYLVTELSEGESYTSVLVFEVEQDFAPETLDLYMTVGESTAHMNLQ